MQDSRRTWPAALPIQPFVGLLVLANLAAFVVAGSTGTSAFRALALVPAELGQRPWTAITYAFLHPSSWQLLVDMAALLLIAPRFESRVGGPTLLGYYLAGALLAIPLGFLAPAAAFAGSSAAVLAVLIGFARRLPDAAVLPLLPGKTRWLVPLLVGVTLLPGIAAAPDAPIRIGHLSLLLVTALTLMRPTRQAPARQVEMPNSHYNAPGVASQEARSRWDAIDLAALHEVNREAVVGVLEKAQELGPSHLSQSESEFLDRMCAASQLNRQLRLGH